MPSLQPLASEISNEVPLVPVDDGRAIGASFPFLRPPFRLDGCPGGAAMTAPQMERRTVADASSSAEYAALPWRISGEGTMEVLLFCRRQDGRWTIPGGACSGTRTELRTAERAAFQDAGVTGRLAPEPVGRFRATRTLADGHNAPCDVTVFGLHVWGTLVHWPRETKILRRWMPLSEAQALAADTGLADLLASVMSGATVQDPDDQDIRVRDDRLSGSAPLVGTSGIGPC
jgi:predicted NUDIX family NTP pyrophosphohydrolase